MIWTALILGFAGSLHCVGMCSPLSMAVTTISHSAMVNKILYNIGRVFTYGVFGATIASVGFAFPISEYQNLLSLALGIILITVGFISVTNLPVPGATRLLSKLNIWLKKIFAKFLARRNRASIFLMGTLNGFLPCGLTFLALSYCVILPTPLEGFLFMIFFGVGTFPALFGFTNIFRWIIQRFHFSSQRVISSLLVISGLTLIMRVFFIHQAHAASTLDVIMCGK
jgi:sulfite exporter TauE/SafE